MSWSTISPGLPQLRTSPQSGFLVSTRSVQVYECIIIQGVLFSLGNSSFELSKNGIDALQPNNADYVLTSYSSPLVIWEKKVTGAETALQRLYGCVVYE